MTDHEGALQKALIAHLKGDATLKALLGDPARIWDQPPEDADWPQLRVGPSQSRPLAADGGGVEHRLTLTCTSLFGGTEEARAVNAAVRARLLGCGLQADGVRTVTVSVGLCETFRATDGRRVFGVVRVRAVTEVV